MDLSERGASGARHPWEIERFRAYRQILADHGSLGAQRVLDVGSGDGWFSESLLTALSPTVQVVCWDIHYTDDELTTDDPRLVRTTTAPSPGFDLVLALDVLEHIERADMFIDEQLRPLGAPGCRVLVGVPAHQWLFGEHDRALGHVRRYRPRDLVREVAGWIDVVDQGPLFTSLVAPRALGVAAERLRSRREGADRRHGVGGWRGGPGATRALGAVLAADNRTTRRLGRVGRRLPGLSYWVYGVVR